MSNWYKATIYDDDNPSFADNVNFVYRGKWTRSNLKCF